MSVVLYFGADQFPLYKDSYKFTPINKETENETEAGTIIRDIKRLGVPNITVSQIITQAWFQKLYQHYTTGSAITVTYFDPNTLANATFSGYIKNLSYDLVSDKTTTYWKASFEVKAY